MGARNGGMVVSHDAHENCGGEGGPTIVGLGARGVKYQNQAKLGGFSAIAGGLLWVASIAWYAQQPIGEDDLKEGWETFNRLVTLIPVFFAAPLYSIHRASTAHHESVPRSLLAVLVGIALAAVFRLLVDIGMLPAPFSILAIMFFALTFLWYLAATLRAGAVSRVAIAVLLATTIVMLAFISTDTDFVWFAAPFGVAWVAVGYTLLKSAGASLSANPT